MFGPTAPISPTPEPKPCSCHAYGSVRLHVAEDPRVTMLPDPRCHEHNQRGNTLALEVSDGSDGQLPPI